MNPSLIRLKIQFFKYDSKNWYIFWIWLKELNFFFDMTQRNWTFLLNATQRVEPFFNVIQRVFLTKMTLSILPFLKYDSRIELFLKNYDSQNWTLPINMTHRMEPFFSIWLKELNPFRNITQRTEPFSTYDSKNWTFFSIELFQYYSKDENFSICFEELNPFLIWPKELTFGKMSQIFEPFLNMTQRIDFFHTIQIIEPYFENWLTELNFLKLF